MNSFCFVKFLLNLPMSFSSNGISSPSKNQLEILLLVIILLNILCTLVTLLFRFCSWSQGHANGSRAGEDLQS